MQRDRSIILLLVIYFIIIFPSFLYGQNLARFAVAASSGGGVTPYGPENMNDGLRESAGAPHWVTDARDNWITLTWASPQILGVMWVDTTFGALAVSAESIDYWDGSGYVPYGIMPGQTNDWMFDFGGLSTTSIRLQGLSTGANPEIHEIEVYEVPPTPTPTNTPVPSPTSLCDIDASMFEHWSACENYRGVLPGTSSRVWEFDDCDYCRDSGNPCFKTPCTFAMYVVAECGQEFHIPLWDNETGNIQIRDCELGTYEDLLAVSTGGWTASGTNIQWQDCGGADPRWNNETTDISFYNHVALCGVYRLEFINWGGFVWDLYANCTGTSDPGFFIYDNLPEARGSLTLRPELSIANLSVTGVCPNLWVGVDVTNTGCDDANVPICVETSIGGHWEFTVSSVGPGITKWGTSLITAPSCSSPFTITVSVDCNDIISECSEAGGSAVACHPAGGGSDSLDFSFEHTPTPIFTSTPTATPTPPPTIFCCWEPAVNAGEPLNSPYRDWHPSLASDNTTLFFASTRPGSWGMSDIWISTRIGPGPEDWSNPVNPGLNVNSQYLDAAPSISFDMKDLYFESYNQENGSIDLFISKWRSLTSDWGPRTPLPPVISLAGYDERHPFISRDGRFLYYDTNRAGGPGDYDIWVSEKIRGSWTLPQALPIPVNSSDYEAAPYIAYQPGARQLYYETTRSGTNELFVCEWNPKTDSWDPPKRMCLEFISALHPSINTTNSEMVYHTRGAIGNYDIFVSVCLPTPTPTGVWYSATPTTSPTSKPIVDNMSTKSYGFLILALSFCCLVIGLRFWRVN